MAWSNSYTPILGRLPRVIIPAPPVFRAPVECGVMPAYRGRFYFDGRGKYRVFNAAVYRFYRSNSAPPAESDPPFATSATLPATPADTYANGTWYLSMSWFNGVIDSGFLPLGPNGETYLRIDLAAGAVTGSPPKAPLDWRVELLPGGVQRVSGVYFEVGSLRATQWSVGTAVDPSVPPADTPTVTQAMATHGLAVLSYSTATLAHGTTINWRVQSRRSDDGGVTWVYSAGSVVKQAISDATGPTAPLVARGWPGQLPEEA